MTTEAPQYDKTIVGFVSKPGDEAWAQAQKLVAATEYTPEYKRQEMLRLFPAALAETEKEAAEELAKLAEREPALEKQARRPFAPPDSVDAVRLQYVTDALHAQVAELSEFEIYARWERALEDGDTVTARVMYDHAAALIRRTRGKGKEQQSIPMGDRYLRLRERTDDFLASPEQRTARAKLRELQETRKQINITLNQTKARFNGWRIDRGELIDGQRAAIRNTVKF